MKRSSFAGINQERVQLTGSGWRNTKENDLLCEYFSVVCVCLKGMNLCLLVILVKMQAKCF